jgi:hypothetical protein
MHILARLEPNNQLKVSKYRIGEGYSKPRKLSDTEKVVREEYLAKNLRQVEILRAILREQSEEKTREEYSKWQETIQLALFGNGTVLSRESNTLEIPYTLLPSSILLVEELGKDEVNVVRSSYEDVAIEISRRLDILKKSQQAKRKERPWGRSQTPKAFVYSAGQKILNGGAVIDKACGAKNSTMLTLTLPGGTEEAIKALADWSGYIVNRMIQVVRRVEDPDAPIYWFFVWEHQKRGALHMHMCLGWRTDQEKREQLARKLKDKFYDVLLGLLARAGVDMFARRGFGGSWRFLPEKWKWDIQQIEKAVAPYFAKYCQKNREYNGGDEGKQIARVQRQGKKLFSVSKGDVVYYPSRYWGSSQTVKKAVKFLTREIRIEVYGESEADMVVNRLFQIASKGFEFTSIHHGTYQIENGSSEIVIASGEVWNLYVNPLQYRAFWCHCMDAIIDRIYDKTRLDEYLYVQ